MEKTTSSHSGVNLFQRLKWLKKRLTYQESQPTGHVLSVATCWKRFGRVRKYFFMVARSILTVTTLPHLKSLNSTKTTTLKILIGISLVLSVVARCAFRSGRFGVFFGCEKYPKCNGIVNIPKKVKTTLKNCLHALQQAVLDVWSKSALVLEKCSMHAQLTRNVM